MMLIYYYTEVDGKSEKTPLIVTPNKKTAEEYIQKNKDKHGKLYYQHIDYYFGARRW